MHQACRLLISSITIGMAFIVGPSLNAVATEQYRPSSITVIVGYSSGGGYDMYARLLARHLGRHLPGAPQIIVQNMPGAGSLRAANYIYNVAPRDGATLGMFSSQTALEPLFGNKGAQFDTVKFAWLGNMFRDVASCGAWRGSQIASFQEMIKSKTQIAFGATGPGTPGNQHALVLKTMLGVNLRVVTGYPGLADVKLALARGEVHAACALSLSTIKSHFLRELNNGELRILIQFGKKNVPLFGNAVNFYSLLKTDDERQVADLFFGQTEIMRPLIGPPGMPPQIVAMLRAATTAALKDPLLLADAAKLNVDIDPVSGEETARILAGFYEARPSVVQTAKGIMGRK